MPSSISLVDDDQDIQILDSPPPGMRRTVRQPLQGLGVLMDPFLVADSDDDEPLASGSRPAQRVAPPARHRRDGPISGMVDPLPFELEMEAEGRPSRRLHPAPPAPSAAARSHHLPLMGLGGALIRQNTETDRAAVARRRTLPVPPRLPNPLRRSRFLDYAALDHAVDSVHHSVWELHHRVVGGAPPPARAPRPFAPFDMLALQHGEEFQDGFWEDDAPLPANVVGGRARWEYEEFLGIRSAEMFPDYMLSYTHPLEKPPADFVYDWGPSEDVPPEGSSENPSDAPTSLLVCGTCRDPLALGGSDGTKVWALRCGHMIDGKCLRAIDRPPPNEGKGKQKEGEPVPPPRGTKRKASDIEESDVASLRSRLRPRVSSTTSVTLGSQQRPSWANMPVNALRTFPLSILKRPKEVKREETYTWRCPIASCIREHTSMLKEGKWAPDPHTGPIALFV